MARALAWAGAASATLVLGVAAVGALVVALGWLHTGSGLGPLQRALWWAFARALLTEALLPQLLVTWAGWLVLVRLAPGWDRSWRAVAPATGALAAAAFVPIGSLGFPAWHPSSGADVAGTLLLCSAGSAAALLLPRWAIHALAPGALAPSRRFREEAR